MRGTVLRTTALKHVILKLVNSLESLRQNRDSNMNTFFHAPLVFSSSSLKQHNMASPTSLHVLEGGVCLGL